MANPRNLGDIAPLVSKSGTTFTLTNNLNFGGTGQRITGDMSNATFGNRLAFQSSTTNGNTSVFALPNGTGVNSSFQTFNNSDPTNAAVGVFGIVGSTDVRIQSSITGTGTYLPMTFYTGGSERVRIDTSGNVGIGTASPGTVLHTVRTSAGAATVGAFLQNSDNTTSTEVRLAFAANSNTLSADRYGWIGYVNTGGTNGGALTFATTPGGTAATERMRIDSSGNVGIGTASPAAKLNVSAASGYLEVRVTSGSNNAYLGADGSNAYVGTYQAIPLQFGTNNTERMRLDASGNLGIGTASPSYTLEINKASGNFRVRDASGGNDVAITTVAGPVSLIGSTGATAIAFGTNNTERLRIASNGAWGLSGANYGNSGQVLTSNGSGSAPTWQAPSGGSPAMTVVTGTTQTAAANSHYVLTNAAASTVTLPATPAAGDIVWVTAANDLTTNVIARNGEKIMGLSEDLTIDVQNATIQLRFVNTTLGWRIL